MAKAPATDGRRIALAAIAGAHGVKGEVRLKLFGDSLASLSAHDEIWLGGEKRRMTHLRDGGKVAIARIDCITSREAAEALRGTLLEVDREAFPPLEEGEYYHADLIGLPCVGPDGNPLGTVVAVENFGAGDLLEVEKPDSRKSLIPFRPGIADLKDEKILLDPAFLA